MFVKLDKWEISRLSENNNKFSSRDKPFKTFHNMKTDHTYSFESHFKETGKKLRK